MQSPGLSLAIRMSGPVEMYERWSCPLQLVASSSVVDLSSSRPVVTRMSSQRLLIPNESIDSSTIRPDLLDCILIFRPRATLLIRERPLTQFNSILYILV